VLGRCLNAREVAQMLSISNGQVGELLRRGKLRGFRIDSGKRGIRGHWRVRPEELERFMGVGGDSE